MDRIEAYTSDTKMNKFIKIQSIVLYGPCGSGKTTFLHKVMTDNFDKKYIETLVSQEYNLFKKDPLVKEINDNKICSLLHNMNIPLDVIKYNVMNYVVENNEYKIIDTCGLDVNIPKCDLLIFFIDVTDITNGIRRLMDTPIMDTPMYVYITKIDVVNINYNKLNELIQFLTLKNIKYELVSIRRTKGDILKTQMLRVLN